MFCGAIGRGGDKSEHLFCWLVFCCCEQQTIIILSAQGDSKQRRSKSLYKNIMAQSIAGENAQFPRFRCSASWVRYPHLNSPYK